MITGSSPIRKPPLIIGDVVSLPYTGGMKPSQQLRTRSISSRISTMRAWNGGDTLAIRKCVSMGFRIRKPSCVSCISDFQNSLKHHFLAYTRMVDIPEWPDVISFNTNRYQESRNSMRPANSCDESSNGLRKSPQGREDEIPKNHVDMFDQHRPSTRMGQYIHD